ncbi:hypothetical protein [Paenibacillus sp. FSL K6-1558]|uniref:hypothetical protein n=1 Tax=Paenibacillus sp. FSL K6-1558 TaxID=2921473 RepID=UPI0012B8B3A8|nr:hypothetical protein [Paenibacillus xylanexedens]
MTRRKRNQWRKWQASAAATLTVAALFQYVRTSDAFDVAYAAANGTDTGITASTRVDSRDDVMDEWSPDGTGQYNWGTDGYSVGSNQNQANSLRSGSESNHGNYQSRTGAS